MPAPTLSTPAARIELRDLATFAWHNWAEIGETDGPSCNRTVQARVAFVAGEIRDLGFAVTVDVRDGASSFAKITVTACDGSTLTLDWDPMLDGFDYEGSGDDGCDLDEIEANTEDEPETASCDFCDGKFIEGEITVTGVPEGGIVYYCDACRAKDANAPRA